MLDIDKSTPLNGMTTSMIIASIATVTQEDISSLVKNNLDRSDIKQIENYAKIITALRKSKEDHEYRSY